MIATPAPPQFHVHCLRKAADEEDASCAKGQTSRDNDRNRTVDRPKQVDKLKQADEQSISDPWSSEDKIHADRLATCRGSDKPKQQPEAREEEEKWY